MYTKASNRVGQAVRAVTLAVTLFTGAGGLPVDAPEPPPSGGGTVEPRWKDNFSIHAIDADYLCEALGGELEEYEIAFYEFEPGWFEFWHRVQCVDPLTDDVIFQCVADENNIDLHCTWGGGLWLPGPDGSHAPTPTEPTPGALDDPGPTTSAPAGSASAVATFAG